MTKQKAHVRRSKAAALQATRRHAQKVRREMRREARKLPLGDNGDVVMTMRLIRQFRSDVNRDSGAPVVTQRWIAEHLGVDTNTVARWERGELACRWNRMLELALGALKPKAEEEVAEAVEKRLRQ